MKIGTKLIIASLLFSTYGLTAENLNDDRAIINAEPNLIFKKEAQFKKMVDGMLLPRMRDDRLIVELSLMPKHDTSEINFIVSSTEAWVEGDFSNLFTGGSCANGGAFYSGRRTTFPSFENNEDVVRKLNYIKEKLSEEPNRTEKIQNYYMDMINALILNYDS
jgi:hypothetical protein